MQVSEKVLEFLESTMRVMAAEPVKIMDELLNYMLFTAVLDLASRFLILLAGIYLAKLLKSYLLVQEEQGKAASEELKATKVGSHEYFIAKAKLDSLGTGKLVRQLRWLVLGGATAAFVYTGMDSMRTIGKIVIAPKIYLIEQAQELIRLGVRK